MFATAGATQDDAEGIIEELRKIAGVEVIYIVREAGDGVLRVSLRSKSQVDVNEIAHDFGGGGHVRAAGCVLTGTLPDAEARLLAAIVARLPGA